MPHEIGTIKDNILPLPPHCLSLRTNGNNPLLISISFHGITRSGLKNASPPALYSTVPKNKTPTQSTQALSELQCKQRTRGETAKDLPLRRTTTTTVPRRRQLCRRNRRHLSRRHHQDHGDRWRPASCDGAVRDAWCSSSLPLRCCSTICCWPSLVSTFLLLSFKSFNVQLCSAVYWKHENIFTKGRFQSYSSIIQSKFI